MIPFNMIQANRIDFTGGQKALWDGNGRMEERKG